MAKVLIVDDNELYLSSTSRLLAERGHRVRQATNPEDALEVAARFRPHIVVADIYMPHKFNADVIDSGKSLFDALHTAYPCLPVILSTGMETDRTRSIEYMRKGAYAYLTSGKEFDRLDEVILRSLKVSKINQEEKSLRELLLVTPDRLPWANFAADIQELPSVYMQYAAPDQYEVSKSISRHDFDIVILDKAIGLAKRTALREYFSSTYPFIDFKEMDYMGNTDDAFITGRNPKEQQLYRERGEKIRRLLYQGILQSHDIHPSDNPIYLGIAGPAAGGKSDTGYTLLTHFRYLAANSYRICARPPGPNEVQFESHMFTTKEHILKDPRLEGRVFKHPRGYLFGIPPPETVSHGRKYLIMPLATRKLFEFMQQNYADRLITLFVDTSLKDLKELNRLRDRNTDPDDYIEEDYRRWQEKKAACDMVFTNTLTDERGRMEQLEQRARDLHKYLICTKNGFPI